MIERHGFDFQYHYSKSKIGGLKQIGIAQNPEKAPSLRENVLLLAETMMAARKTKGMLKLRHTDESCMLIGPSVKHTKPFHFFILVFLNILWLNL